MSCFHKLVYMNVILYNLYTDVEMIMMMMMVVVVIVCVCV